MEVRPGYKLTEVGVIPGEWALVPLKELSAFITKGATPTTYGFKWESDGIVFLRSECVSEAGLDLKESMLISAEAHAALVRGEVHAGDILMTITGNVGRVIILATEFGFANINQHIARIRLTDLRTYPSFVYYFLSQPAIRARYNLITTGQAYPQISLTQVRETCVPLPPLPEQRAIATALSDVDALIVGLDRLIAKKRDLKQSAMQQLLTGQERLPGFRGEWDRRPFGEVLFRIDAKAYQIQATDYQWTGTYPVVDQGKDFVSGYSERADRCLRCPAGGVIVFGDHTCIVKFVNFDFVVGADGVQIMSAKSEQCTRFHAYQMQYSGIPTTGYNRHFGFLRERTFAVPPLPEQRAIAAVLSDMDAEIGALEARRDKTRLLKQGMMQELLTGRTRLLTTENMDQ